MTAPRILIVAGSDSSGGAGIQADIKAVTMFGGHAMTAITAVTAQDTQGVAAIHPIPPEMVAAQIAAVLGDIGLDAVKTGMLGDIAMIEAVVNALSGIEAPIVVDPVIVATSGARLLPEEAVTALADRLLPKARLVTPNIPELEALTGMAIADETAARTAGLRLARRCGALVLVKGGHLPGATIVDLLVARDGRVARWADPRIETRHTHGTGCTLASAIATGLGEGRDILAAVERARGYVRAAIAAAPGYGAGHGPIGHALGRAHL